MNELYILDTQANDQVNLINYNRLETRDSDEPNQEDLKEWRKGALQLWLCDYTFKIEKRVIRPITLEECKRAGITYDP